jgi:hypothetical protein
MKLVQWSFSLSVVIFLSGTNLLCAVESQMLELTEAPKDMTWVNIVVPSNDTTLEDLALIYYGDIREASLIYNANIDTIPKSKKLKKGMKLKMPVTKKYIDQPEHLGWN